MNETAAAAAASPAIRFYYAIEMGFVDCLLISDFLLLLLGARHYLPTLIVICGLMLYQTAL